MAQSSIQFDFSGMNSTLLIRSTAQVPLKGRRASGTFAHLGYSLGVSAVALILSATTGAPYLWPSIALLVDGYFGLRAFSDYQVFSSTPLTKVSAAPYGLGEFTVRAVPETEVQLQAPISKAACTYYRLELHEMRETGYGKNRHAEDVIVGVTQHGVPTLLSDGSGYLMADFNTGDIHTEQNYFRPDLPGSGPLSMGLGGLGGAMGMVDGGAARAYLAEVEAARGGTVTNMMQFTKGSGNVYFIEYYMPLDKDLFALGVVSATDKMFRNAPLKQIGVDTTTKIFSVLPEPKGKAMNSLLITAGVSILLLFAMLFLAYYTYGHGKL